MKSKKSSATILIIAIVFIVIFSVGAFFAVKFISDNSAKNSDSNSSSSSVNDEYDIKLIFTPTEDEPSQEDIDTVKAVFESRLKGQKIFDFKVFYNTKSNQFEVLFQRSVSIKDFTDDMLSIFAKEMCQTSTIVFRKGSCDVNGEIVLKGTDIKSVKPGVNPEGGNYILNIYFTEQGSQKFELATSQMIGQYLSIFLETTTLNEETGEEELDQLCLSAPQIMSAIDSGECYISGGNMTADYVTALANQINFGKLPFSIVFDENNSKLN